MKKTLKEAGKLIVLWVLIIFVCCFISELMG